MDFWTEWLFWVFFFIALFAMLIRSLAERMIGKNKVTEVLGYVCGSGAIVAVVLTFLLVSWQGGLVSIAALIVSYCLQDTVAGLTYEDHEY